jgi:hypothetical protein
MILHSSIKLMVMEDCNDGLPSVDVAMVEIRRDEPDLLEDTEYEIISVFPERFLYLSGKRSIK